jgi:O-succinylhomoserine sulfhydrylase
MSPFNAWVLLKGLETMRLRVEHQSEVAMRLARWLEERDGVRTVRYPHLPSHPQYDLAKRQMSGGGSVVTFELDVPAGAARAASFALLDALRIVDISNNLGDAKSLVTHPATTTHRRLTPEARAAAGITDGVVRLSVGLEAEPDLLEDPADLIDDLAQALGTLTD